GPPPPRRGPIDTGQRQACGKGSHAGFARGRLRAETLRRPSIDELAATYSAGCPRARTRAGLLANPGIGGGAADQPADPSAPLRVRRRGQSLALESDLGPETGRIPTDRRHRAHGPIPYVGDLDVAGARFSADVHAVPTGGVADIGDTDIVVVCP